MWHQDKPTPTSSDSVGAPSKTPVTGLPLVVAFGGGGCPSLFHAPSSLLVLGPGQD